MDVFQWVFEVELQSSNQKSSPWSEDFFCSHLKVGARTCARANSIIFPTWNYTFFNLRLVWRFKNRNISFNFSQVIMMKNENLLYIDDTDHFSYHKICMCATARAKLQKIWIILKRTFSTNFTKYILFVNKVNSRHIIIQTLVFE